MNIKKIRFENFRSYTDIRVDFEKGINFIYGDNASGKTNLVEGIYYFAFARSFRTKDDCLLKKNGETATYLRTIYNRYGYENKIEISLPPIGKRILINDKKISKVSELSKQLNIIYFIPNDVNLLKASPKDRRNYLDMVISKVDNSYLDLIVEYNKVLKERNALLKNTDIDLNLLDIIDEKYIDLNYKIYKFRLEFVRKINNVLPEIFNKLFLKDVKAHLIYKSFVKNYKTKDELGLYIKSQHDVDIKFKISVSGIQKDDFSLFINDKDVGKYGSQGENRLSTICLKMVNYFLSDDDNKPIVIMDDVLSELDKEHEDSLIEFLKTLEQVFITSTKKYEINGVHYYYIKNSNITKEVN